MFCQTASVSIQIIYYVWKITHPNHHKICLDSIKMNLSMFINDPISLNWDEFQWQILLFLLMWLKNMPPGKSQHSPLITPEPIFLVRPKRLFLLVSVCAFFCGMKHAFEGPQCIINIYNYIFNIFKHLNSMVSSRGLIHASWRGQTDFILCSLVHKLMHRHSV